VVGWWLLPAVAWALTVVGAGGAVSRAGVFAATGSEAGMRGGSVMRIGAGGTFLVNGRATFPIALNGPPPLTSRTPWGRKGLDQVVSAGVNFFVVGPSRKQWTLADIAAVKAWDEAAAIRGVHTIVSLARVSAARPDSRDAGLLWKIVSSLTSGRSSRGLGFWKGADEPLWARVPAAALRYAYCRVTSRGRRRWCAGKPPLDLAHLWLTIQAPYGDQDALAAYNAVTDVAGVDVFPVSTHTRTPDLHQVGLWTRTLASISRNHATWTTLEICSGHSYYRHGGYVVPTRRQERYMIYDAIINGARGLGFYGGDHPRCWNTTDRTHGWNWSYWQTTLSPLISQISAGSPLASALLHPATTRRLRSNDPTLEAISRTGHGLWIIAANSSNQLKTITITGLPNLGHGSVYTENRHITINQHQLTDHYQPWQVHIYHFKSLAARGRTQRLRAAAGRTGSTEVR
jgi:hypothetical protein